MLENHKPLMATVLNQFPLELYFRVELKTHIKPNKFKPYKKIIENI